MTGSASGPLAGRRVVVTRASDQASELSDRLTGLGATVVHLPAIAIADPPDGGAALSEAVGRLVSGAYRWVAFTSANAVDRFLAELDGRPVPGTVRWAAVGPGTARSLVRAGHPPDLVPAVAVSEDLAAVFPVLDPPGTGTVLFPRAESVRGALAAGLRARGWLVDDVVAYRTVAGDPDPGAVRSAVRSDAVAFTSSSTVSRTLELLGTGGIPPVVVTIGPVTSAAARDAGLEVVAEADPHTIDGLVEAVAAAFRGGPARPAHHDQPQ